MRTSPTLMEISAILFCHSAFAGSALAKRSATARPSRYDSQRLGEIALRHKGVADFDVSGGESGSVGCVHIDGRRLLVRSEGSAGLLGATRRLWVSRDIGRLTRTARWLSRLRVETGEQAGELRRLDVCLLRVLLGGLEFALHCSKIETAYPGAETGLIRLPTWPDPIWSEAHCVERLSFRAPSGDWRTSCATSVGLRFCLLRILLGGLEFALHSLR